MTNKNDLGAAWKSLTGWLYKRYNGVLVERSGTGFKVGERYYPTWEEVIEGIDRRRKEFQELIKKQNPQT
jgi:hypothetical protein